MGRTSESMILEKEHWCVRLGAMKTVLALLISVTVCCVLCSADQAPDPPHPATATQRSQQSKDYAAFLSATRDFMSVVKKITIEKDTSAVVEGRGNRGLMKIAVPLIAGFKAAALVVSSLVVLKGLLLKSFMFSALALTVSAGLAFKYLYDKVQGPQGIGGGGGIESIYNSYSQGWNGGGGDQVWQGSSAVELQGGGSTGHDPYSLSGAGDLQGHFSEHIQRIAANTSRIPYAAQRKSVPVQTGVKTTVYKTTIKRIDE